MSTVAGHTFDNDGVCRKTKWREGADVPCGMSKRQLRGIVYEYRALGKAGTEEHNIAHTGTCTQTEWLEACAMVDAEDKAFDDALAQVCRA